MEIGLAGGIRLGVAGVLEQSSAVECGRQLRGGVSVQETVFDHGGAGKAFSFDWAEVKSWLVADCNRLRAVDRVEELLELGIEHAGRGEANTVGGVLD